VGDPAGGGKIALVIPEWFYRACHLPYILMGYHFWGLPYYFWGIQKRSVWHVKTQRALIDRHHFQSLNDYW